MKTLKVMIGLPRSGKSTWIRYNKTNEVIVSADDLRYIVYGQRFWADGEPNMWAIRGMMLKCLMQQGVDLIIDETNTTKERRKPILKMAQEYGYCVTGYVIMTDEKECISRAIEEQQPNLIGVIERMSKQFQQPEINEGFERLIFI